MKTLQLSASAPVKYLRQEPGDEGTTLVVDPDWLPDPTIEYVTSVTISPESDDEQALAEIMTIASIHCAGKIEWVSGNCPELVAATAAIYNAKIKELT